MPWKETCPVEERFKFMVMYQAEEWSIAELCREFGISRTTAYKWIARYEGEGLDGLKDRSRAPHHQPYAAAPEVEQAVVALRRQYPRRGPKKLLAMLQQASPGVAWPALSTIGDILKRNGLVAPRRRSRKTPPYEQPFAGYDYPNAVWSADFKGWFVTGDGQRCEPLTISDNYSRFLLKCQRVSSTGFAVVQPIFEAVFQEYGLPEAIRCDNGPPFATSTVGGLSKLSIWWLKLGIVPERIRPGSPSQNGRHERMHRTLKDETASPPKATGRQQQAAFDRFRYDYNYERPHESLGQQPPVRYYQPSPRPYPLLLPEMVYPNDMLVRSVKKQGDIWWQGRHVYLSQTLAGERVGLQQVADDRWDIYFGPIRLAQLNATTKKLIHLKQTTTPKQSNGNKKDKN
ncbi:MAG: IS481 family transposase [Candidatus Zixiibacteriota bacterium]